MDEFSKADADNSGVLEYGEVEAICKCKTFKIKNMSRKRMLDLWEMLDVDESEFITWTELLDGIGALG